MAIGTYTISFAGMESSSDISGIRTLLEKYSKLSVSSEVQKLVFPQQVRLCLNALEQLRPQLQAKVLPEDTTTMHLFHQALAHLRELSSPS